MPRDVVHIKCRVCGVDKPESEFYARHSVGLEGRRMTICKLCGSEKNRAWREAAQDPRLSFRVSLNSARRRGIDVQVSFHDIIAIWEEQQGRCAISNLPMSWAKGNNKGLARWDSVSIDRIDSTLGYIPGNLRLILFCINAFRGSASDEQMHRVVDAILKHRVIKCPVI